MAEMSIRRVIDQLRALGVRTGTALLVHTSFKAVGPIEQGPLGLIRALRTAVGEQGSVVMPTMSDGTSVFDPRSTPSCGMGITAELFWQQPGTIRSTHPGASFAAQGPHAEFICQPHPLSPPHGPDSPVGRVHELGGQVLLLGVGHGENTTLHLAETIAMVPYWVAHPCVVEVEGTPRTVMIPETDHCCSGFGRADEWLRTRNLQREGTVGNAHARLCNSTDIVSVAVQYLTANPLVFLCPPTSNCDECKRAHASVSGGNGT